MQRLFLASHARVGATRAVLDARCGAAGLGWSMPRLASESKRTPSSSLYFYPPHIAKGRCLSTSPQETPGKKAEPAVLEPAAATAAAASAGDETKAAKPKKPTLDKRVWPIAASSLLMGCSIGVIMPVMPIFAKDLGLSPTDLGLVVSVMGLTRLAFNIPSAWATERFGRRSTLIGGPFLSAIGMGLMSTAHSFSELVSYRFLTGIGGSMQMTGAQMYLSDISNPTNRARTLAPLGIGFATGATVGPAVGGLLADSYGLRAPFVFVAGAICLVSLSNFVLVPETRKVALAPTVDEKGEAVVDQGSRMRAELRNVVDQWRPLLRDPNMRAVLLMHFTYWAAASGCIWTLLPLLAQDSFNLQASSLGGIFALMSLMGIVGMQPAAWVSDTLGRKKAMLPAIALLAPSFVAVPLCSSYNELLGAVVVYATGAAFFQATPQAFVADISTESNRGQALAMLRSAGDAGLMMGAGSFGFLAHHTSNEIAFTLASVGLTGAVANFMLVAKETPRDSKVSIK